MSATVFGISICSIQILILISEATSNPLQPKYSVKIFNTETVILSLGDPDDAKNNDLEIIKASPGKSLVDKKMGKFHKYVNLMEMTESPEQRLFFRSFQNKLKNPAPLLSVSYPDTAPESEDVDQRPLKRPTRRKKNKIQNRLRSPKSPPPAKGRRIRKRQVQAETTPPGVKDDPEWDYLKAEYLDFVRESMKNNMAFKYSDEGKPEESFKEIVYKITDVKTPQNCTEYAGIGLQAVECVVQNFKTGDLDQKHMIYSISFIVLVWFGLYLAVALPLWCAKGWCCCCCRCQFCLPHSSVKEIQKYLAQNPPGIYVNSEGEEERYNPTPTEIELYERLKRAINEF